MIEPEERRPPSPRRGGRSIAAPRPALAALAAVVLVAATLVGGSSTALAASGMGGDGNGETAGAPPTSQVVGDCRLHASSDSFGQVCPRPGGGRSVQQVIRDVLNGSPLPQCWHRQVLPGFKPPRETFGEPGTWWRQTCIKGIDLTTYQQNGEIEFAFNHVFLPEGEERLLTSQEITAIGLLYEGKQIFYPVVEMLPSRSPRVGTDVLFQLDEVSSESAQTAGIGGVRMQSVLVGVEVLPEGEGGPLKPCGPQRVTPAEFAARALTEASYPDGCWHTFDRSSAGLGEESPTPDRYPARVRSLWDIQYTTDGGGTWTSMSPGRPFVKESINPLRVTEVQTLVIS